MKATEAEQLAQALIERDSSHRTLTNLKVLKNLGDDIEDAHLVHAGTKYVDAVSKISSLVSRAQHEKEPANA